MDIFLDSLPIYLAPDGASVRYEPRAEIRRRYDGTLRSSITSSRGFVRVWELRTPEEDASTIETLVAALSGGSLTFSGDLVASGGVKVYPREITRRIGRNADYATLSFELWEDATIADERKELVRVFVADSTDHLQNLSEWFIGATIQADVESFAKTASVRFWRETQSESKAPLMNDPQPIAPGRRILLETAIIGLDEAVEEGDWEFLFEGRIDDTAWGGNASEIVVPCRDKAGRLHDAWVLDETEYGDNVSPTPIEDVMQAILDDNLTVNPPTIYVEGDPDFGIIEYTQQRQSLQDAIIALRDNIGWDFRAKWNASDQENQLTLYEPDRDKTTPDHIFDADDYFEITEVELSALGVRNYVIVDWDTDEAAVVAEDSSSIAEYANEENDGIYPLLLDETGNLQINSQAKALALAEAILAETAFPALSHTARNAFVPEIEIGDLCRYPANGVHYNAAQDVAITGYTHEIRPEGNSTTILSRGSPRGSVTRWYTKAKAATVREVVREVVEEETDPTTLADRIEFYYTTPYGPGYSQESTAAESLGGYISKTKLTSGLYGLFRKVTAAEATAGITLYRSVAIINTDQTSSPEQWEGVLAFVSPEDGASGEYTWSFAVDPVGVVDVTDETQQGSISSYEEAPPDASPALSWTSPLEDGSPLLDVGTIGPQEGVIVHIKLEVTAGASGQFTDESLIFEDQVPAG